MQQITATVQGLARVLSCVLLSDVLPCRAYEADAIQVWLSLNNDYFPGGSVKVLTRDLIPAAALKQEIQEWKRKHKAGLSQGARTFSAALQ